MDEWGALFRKLGRRISALEAQLESVKRKQVNTIREGKVTKLHPETGEAEVDMFGLASSRVPWIERAGTQKSWDPPSIGERVVVFAPNGDLGRAMVLPGGYSDDNPQPHKKAGERFYTIGETSDLNTGSDRTIIAKTIRLEAGESVTIIAGSSSIIMNDAGITLKGAVIKENE